MTDRLPHCLNCGASLGGQYCGQCGQRARSRLISLWELTRDAFGDLFELDSRLWRTLIPLLARPGRLTRDYLEGRRARYMPPFRMYLVLSLVFFLIAFFDPHKDFELLFEPDAATESAGPVDADESARLEAARAEGRREVQEALDELVRDGVIDESLIGPDGPIVLREDGGPAVVPETRTPSPPPEPALPDEDSGSVNFSVGDTGAIDCDRSEFDLTDLPQWLQRRLTPERLERLCARWEAAGAEGFSAALLDRIPAGLILLLPVMALILKVLYPLSRRYYVEHLLFFVHFHAFLFLLLSLQILWARTVGILGWWDAVAILPIVASSFYAPVYLFKAMRRVYGQGFLVTFLKFCVLAIAYLAGFSLMLAGALLLAAISV